MHERWRRRAQQKEPPGLPEHRPPLVKARAEAWFTGKGMTEKDFNPFFRGIIKKLFSAGEGDMRDWTKIRAWAEGLSLD